MINWLIDCFGFTLYRQYSRHVRAAWRLSKIFSRTTGPNLTKLGTRFVQVKGHEGLHMWPVWIPELQQLLNCKKNELLECEVSAFIFDIVWQYMLLILFCVTMSLYNISYKGGSRTCAPPPPFEKNCGVVFVNFDCIVRIYKLILVNMQCSQNRYLSLLSLRRDRVYVKG